MPKRDLLISPKLYESIAQFRQCLRLWFNRIDRPYCSVLYDHISRWLLRIYIRTATECRHDQQVKRLIFILTPRRCRHLLTWVTRFYDVLMYNTGTISKRTYFFNDEVCPN